MEPITSKLIEKLSLDADTLFEVDTYCQQSLRVFHDRRDFQEHFQNNAVEISQGLGDILEADRPPTVGELETLYCPTKENYPTDRGAYLVEMEHTTDRVTHPNRFYGGSGCSLDGIKYRWEDCYDSPRIACKPSNIKKAITEGYQIKNKFVLFLIKDSTVSFAEVRFLGVVLEALSSAYLWLHESRSEKHTHASLALWDLEDYEYEGLCSHSCMADAWGKAGFSTLMLTDEELKKVALLEKANQQVRELELTPHQQKLKAYSTELGLSVKQLTDPLTGKATRECPASGCGRIFGAPKVMRKHYKAVHILGGTAKIHRRKRRSKEVMAALPKKEIVSYKQKAKRWGKKLGLAPSKLLDRVTRLPTNICPAKSCGRSFSSGNDMRRHYMRIHINGGTTHNRPGHKKPAMAETVQQRAKRWALELNLAVKHIIDPVTGVLKTTCPACGKSHDRSEAMRKHYVKKHQG